MLEFSVICLSNLQIFADNDKTIAALAGLNLIPARWFRMPGKERKRKERRKEGRKEERKEGRKEGRKERQERGKPVAQRQEKVIGTLALLWYFMMVAVM